MLEGKIGGKSASRIDKAYKTFDEQFSERPELERRFRFVMDQVETHFDSDFSDFAFFDKRLAYTFLLFIYDLTIGLATPMTKKARAKELKLNQVSAIKLASQRIKERTASENVLTSTDRRTTNPKERGILFNYLQKSVSHA
jgi:hypothetical protein